MATFLVLIPIYVNQNVLLLVVKCLHPETKYGIITLTSRDFRDRRQGIPLGVKFGREYDEIIAELTEAIRQIRDIFTVFEMTADDWTALDAQEQKECIRTLADDIFYGLGANRELPIGCGTIHHDKDRHILTVRDGASLVTLIHLA